MNYPIVMMDAQIRIYLSKPFNKENYIFDIGGFGFVVNGCEVPFDFDASGYNVQGSSDDRYVVTIDFFTGEGPFFNDRHLSADFDADYHNLGLNRSDITAEYLAKVTTISEFFVNAEVDNEEALVSYELLSVSLYDDISAYDIEKTILDLFNVR